MAALFLALAASAAPASPREDRLRRFHLAVPESWLAEDPAPRSELGELALAVRNEGRRPAFHVFRVGPKMTRGDLKTLAETWSQTQLAAGASVGPVHSQAHENGLFQYYYGVESSAGSYFEGPAAFQGETLWLRSVDAPQAAFLQLSGRLRLGPAAPGPSRAPDVAAESRGAVHEFRVSDRTRDRLTVHGRWFSVVPPPGFEPARGGSPQSVLALEGPGRIELFRVPPRFGPRLRAGYHFGSLVFPRLQAEDLRRHAALAMEDPALGRGWSWLKGRNGWIAGELRLQSDRYWFLALDAPEPALGSLLAGIGPPYAPSGAPPFPVAPGGAPGPASDPRWLLPAALLAAAATWWLLFARPKLEPPPAADAFATEDLLARTSPWLLHPLGKVRLLDDGGFARHRLRIVGPKGDGLRAEWYHPERPLGLFAAALAFCAWLGAVAPLGSDAFGRFFPAAGAAALAGAAAWALCPKPRVRAVFLNERGLRVGELVRDNLSGLSEERYRILGIEKEILGVVARPRAHRLLFKHWRLKDNGNVTVLRAAEPLLHSLVRRFVGRLGGLFGASLVLLEGDQVVGELRSRGAWKRRLEFELHPKTSRALVSLDPRALLGLLTAVMERDRDPDYPWPLA